MWVINWISKSLGLGLGVFATVAVADAPKRVVSVNLCTDQMAMHLAAPEQLVSISYLALDPHVSAMSEEAKNYPINHGDLEEIVALKPDLVLAYEWTSPILIQSLEGIGIRVERFATPTALEGIPDFVAQMGAALGQETTANAVNQSFNSKLNQLTNDAQSLSPAFRLISYGPNGWVGGADTLGAEVVSKAGFDNLADSYGFSQGGFMPLETLIVAKPDVVLTDDLYPTSSRSEALLSHPALKEARLTTHQMQFGQAWSCGLPQSLDGFAELIALHRALESKVH